MVVLVLPGKEISGLLHTAQAEERLLTAVTGVSIRLSAMFALHRAARPAAVHTSQVPFMMQCEANPETDSASTDLAAHSWTGQTRSRRVIKWWSNDL